MNLDTPIQFLKGVGPKMALKLGKLGIQTIEDLLFYFPRTWLDLSKPDNIDHARIGDQVVVNGKIISISQERSFKKRMAITRAEILSGDGEVITAVWFNQPFIQNNLHSDETWIFYGKIDYDWKSKQKIILSPILEKNFSILSIYPETAGVTSKYLRHLIKNLYDSPISIPDFLPKSIIFKEKLLAKDAAIKEIHLPNSNSTLSQAKYRLAFEELFLIALKIQLLRAKNQILQSTILQFKKNDLQKLVKSLPYQLTNAQRKASWQIIEDLAKPTPMNRLLNGDVGSGKTIVAIMAALNTIKNKFQVAWMAPTEILARQHYQTACEFLKDFGVKIALVTSNNVTSNQLRVKSQSKSLKLKRTQLKSLTQTSELIIGTHALIQAGIQFPNLGLVIIDEQHRFGVSQRAALAGCRLTQTKTQTNADDDFLYKELSYKIRGLIFKVKKELNLGQKESIYQKALEEELKINKISFEKEKSVDILYNNKKIGVYRPDFVIEDKIILELKSLPFIGKIEKRQVWQYLKGSKYKLAILVNFGEKDIRITRIIYDSLRESDVSQRQSAKMVPHFLSMTATPIPRTLTLALYGDLDISVLDEMPSNRHKIITKLVDSTNRDKAYQFVRDQIKAGRQVFVICPLIEENIKHQIPPRLRSGQANPKHLDHTRGGQIPNAKFKIQNLFELERKSVKTEFEKLSNQIFPDLKIGMLHGKLKSVEKEQIMRDFSDKKIDILVSTSVIEVGIDIPNATVMMIEDADRFGLSQLHQFRGRVGRAKHQSYCLLFSNSQSEDSQKRLEILEECIDGFKLAQKDLEIRGPGELVGVNQSGFPDLKMASLTDIMLIEKTKHCAETVVNDGLDKYPLLRGQLKQSLANHHWE